MNAAGVAEAEPWRWRQALAPPPGLPAGLRVLWSIVEVVDLLDANARVDLVHVLRRELHDVHAQGVLPALRPSPPRWEVHDVSRVHLLILAQQPQGQVGGCSHLPEGPAGPHGRLVASHTPHRLPLGHDRTQPQCQAWELLAGLALNALGHRRLQVTQLDTISFSSNFWNIIRVLTWDRPASL